MDIKRIIKKNVSLYNFLLFCDYKIHNAFTELTSYIGLSSSQGWKSLKGKYKGERCFIVATGPSLKYDDLEKLKNEYTISMNSIVKAYCKTEWRATFIGIQDRNVYDAVLPELKMYCKDNLLISDYCNDSRAPKGSIVFPYNGYYNGFEDRVKHRFFSKFNGNGRLIYDGYSITYSLIQCAVYMGFTTIFLLGCDCSFDPSKKLHFIEHGVRDQSYEFTHEKQVIAYSKARKETEKKGIKIYNCTRGGQLEVFIRKDFDSIQFK